MEYEAEYENFPQGVISQQIEDGYCVISFIFFILFVLIFYVDYLLKGETVSLTLTVSLGYPLQDFEGVFCRVVYDEIEGGLLYVKYESCQGDGQREDVCQKDNGLPIWNYFEKEAVERRSD